MVRRPEANVTLAELTIAPVVWLVCVMCSRPPETDSVTSTLLTVKDDPASMVCDPKVALEVKVSVKLMVPAVADDGVNTKSPANPAKGFARLRSVEFPGHNA